MTRTETLMPRPSIQPDRDLSRSLVSLIEVPAVKSSRMRRPHFRAHARVDGRGQGRRPCLARSRRRLRREIRIVGCALLVLAPLLSACTLLSSTGPVRVLACSITEATARSSDRAPSAGTPEVAGQPEIIAGDPPGVVVLSVEPTVPSPVSDAEVPVIFPGYVLPDDSLEGSTHEGS